MSSTYRFDEFAFSPERQTLTRGGARVRVGSRALAILHLLIERSGGLVTKRDILTRVWPGSEVGEENIRLNIAALRRALKDDQTEQRFIVTDHGRGYRFVAPTTEAQPAASLEVPPDASPARSHLPTRLTSLVGRDEDIELLARCQRKNRLLTIVGPGGIGKTSVAVELARSVSAHYIDGAWLLDLAPLEDPQRLALTVGSVLGIEQSAADPFDALLGFLRTKRMLLVLDNCEHLVEQSAQLATQILAAAAGVDIITTSREALGAAAEYVYRLDPLPTPPAVRLFVERARSRSMHYNPEEMELESVANICGQLDGNPLAIELAAAAVATAGVAGIAAGLDRRFALLTRGYRTSHERHRSLRAVMDWSYEFLPSHTQTVLCRLSVFRGGFTLEAAEEIAHCSQIGQWQVVEHLNSLTDKSLVVSNPEAFVPEFRLLETVRAYATERFLPSGELDSRMERLAERCRRVFGQTPDKSKIGISSEQRSTYIKQVEDLRASMTWAFASEARLPMGIALAIAAGRTLDSLGLFTECYQILRTAVERVEKAESVDKQGLMQMYALLGPMSTWVSPTGNEAAGICRRLLELARETNRVDFQLSALRSLVVVALLSGQNAQARSYSVQMAEMGSACGDAEARVVAQQRVGALSSIMGAHDAALRIFAEIGIDTRTDNPNETARYAHEPVCIQKAYLSRTLWCTGQLDDALAEAMGAVERADRLAHLPTQFVTLIQAAALIPLWTGPYETAAHTVQLCNDLAGEDPSRKMYARIYSACLQIYHGDATAGTRQLQRELLGPEFDINILAPSQAVFYTALAEGMYRVHATEDALALVTRALEQTRESAGTWFDPELLRIRACALSDRGAPVEAVESSFEMACATARQQGALYWELRATFSYAQYLLSLGRAEDACRVLKPVYGKFAQGLGLADLRAARELLDTLI